jgi:hypothetical protein
MSKKICFMCRLLFFVGVVFITPERGLADERRGPQVAAVLQDEFETVFYLKSNLLSGPAPSPQLSGRDTRYLRFPFAYLSQGIDSLRPQASDTILQKSDAVLVGAKDFQPPPGLGIVRSKRCYVIILNNHTVFDLSDYFQRQPVVSVGNSRVWNWSAMLGEFGEGDPRPSSLFATQLGSSYLVVSNDLVELQNVATKLAAPGDEAQALNNLRDWATLSNHDVWAYRRYRHEEVMDREAAGLSFVSQGAKSLIFFADLDKKSATIRLLCSTKDESTVTKINDRAMLPPLKSSGPEMWETMVPLLGDEESLERIFAVMYLFGFAVYI